jgi:hypothetical protein
VPAEAIASGLDTTVTARWRADLVGSRSVEKMHWRTKTSYYEAVCQLLTAGATRPLNWKSIVDAVRPRGSRSTFYEVTGPHAKHALIALLRASDCVNTAQLTLRYTREAPVEQLIDEAKVHQYWPYHTAWLRQVRAEPGRDAAALTESLLSVVIAWARCNRALATALDHAPPICAVEDLLAVNRGQLSAVRGYAILAAAVEDAVRSPIDGVDVAREPAGPAPVAVAPGAGASHMRVVWLAEQISAIRREAQRLPAQDAAAIWRAATDLIRDLMVAMT